MRKPAWLLSALPLVLLLAGMAAPASADPATPPLLPASFDVAAPPACGATVPSPGNVSLPAPGMPDNDGNFTPMLCIASFCSQNEGVRCIAVGNCHGKCRYGETADPNCTLPDPLPFTWGCGCT